MAVGLTLLSVVIVLYAATALLLGRWFISMPMVFVAIGYWLGPGGANLFPLSLHAESVKLLSVLLHGLSAQPLARLYTRRLTAIGGKPAELVEFSELRKRHAVFTGRPRNAQEARR
jgi:hypothetical protein